LTAGGIGGFPLVMFLRDSKRRKIKREERTTLIPKILTKGWWSYLLYLV
jgi:hypothetical protein